MKRDFEMQMRVSKIEKFAKNLDKNVKKIKDDFQLYALMDVFNKELNDMDKILDRKGATGFYLALSTRYELKLSKVHKNEIEQRCSINESPTNRLRIIGDYLMNIVDYDKVKSDRDEMFAELSKIVQQVKERFKDAEISK